MDTMVHLSSYLRNRVSELRSLKKEGKKIVGYIPGGFIPEELVWAGEAIPVGLIRGGDYEAVTKSLEFLPRFFDTFSRSQIGYWALGEPLYRMVDLIVVPCTDKNVTAIADCFEMWTDKKVLKLGIPHNNQDAHAYRYYLESLYLLKDEVEKLTDNLINEEKLGNEINASNKIRFFMREISEMRKLESSRLSGRDFIKLHHASFIADRYFMENNLEALYLELKGKAGTTKSPRIFLIGSSIADGDYKIYDILDSMGAEVVVEDFSEGMRPYWEKVRTDGNLVDALADAYFRKRTNLPAFFRPAQNRISFLLELAKEFRVDGIIWYSMMYREPYDIEGVYFGRIAEKEGIPFLKVTSDYNPAERTPLRNRIEAFIEFVREGSHGRRKETDARHLGGVKHEKS